MLRAEPLGHGGVQALKDTAKDFRKLNELDKEFVDLGAVWVADGLVVVGRG